MHLTRKISELCFHNMTAESLLREQVIEGVRSFTPSGLGVGTSGNLSVRIDDGFLITPTGVPYDELTPEMIVKLSSDGEVVESKLLPSSEWRFHCDLYNERDEAGAIVHVHSPFATSLACNRQSIPAFHYMIAVAGGDSIRCADYATFGTKELSENVVQAIQDRKACLMANHGLLAFDKDVAGAFKMAMEVEELAKQYYLSLQIGDPVILDNEEMDIIVQKFKSYGKQKRE